MQFDFKDYYDNLTKGNVILAYNGTITADGINGMLESVEGKLDSLNVDPKIKKKIYNVLVEGLQNLYHHVDDSSPKIIENFAHKFGVIVVKKNDSDFQISMGNFVDNKKVPYLKDKIDKINSLSEDELKEMYKFILNHQKLSAKGGGGLGLLDMARKTGNKLQYYFYDFDDDNKFFNLDVYITN